jgi:predicted transcriptional regulator
VGCAVKIHKDPAVMTLLEQIYLKVVITQEMDGNCIFSYQTVVDMSPTTFQVGIHQDTPWMHRHE